MKDFQNQNTQAIPKAELKTKVRKDFRKPILTALQTCIAVLAFSLILIVSFNLPDYFSKPVVSGQISITGNEILPEEEIIEYLNLKDLGLWHQVDPYLLSVRLNQHPWIETASVHRTTNHGISIQVHETKPVAYLKTKEQLYLLSPDCRILSRKASNRWNDLPIIVQNHLGKIEPGSYLPKVELGKAFEILEILSKSDSLPKNAISEINITDPLNTVLVTIPYGINIKLGAGQYHSKLANLKSALPVLLKERGNIRYIDLRYQKAIVYKKKV